MSAVIPLLFAFSALLFGRRSDAQTPRATPAPTPATPAVTTGTVPGGLTADQLASIVAAARQAPAQPAGAPGLTGDQLQAVLAALRQPQAPAPGQTLTADQIAAALAAARQASPPHTPTPAGHPAAPPAPGAPSGSNPLGAILAALQRGAGVPGMGTPGTGAPGTPAAPRAPGLPAGGLPPGAQDAAGAILAGLLRQAPGAPPAPGSAGPVPHTTPSGAGATMTPIGSSTAGPQVLASRQLASYVAHGGTDRGIISGYQRQMGVAPTGTVDTATQQRMAQLEIQARLAGGFGA